MWLTDTFKSGGYGGTAKLSSSGTLSGASRVRPTLLFFTNQIRPKATRREAKRQNFAINSFTGTQKPKSVLRRPKLDVVTHLWILSCAFKDLRRKAAVRRQWCKQARAATTCQHHGSVMLACPKKRAQGNIKHGFAMSACQQHANTMILSC